MPAASRPSRSRWLAGFLVLTLLVALWPARAEGPDDEYLQVYSLIQQADDLNTSGKPAPAKAKYQQAQSELKKFQQSYPEWNTKLISYRLNYVSQKLSALAEAPRQPEVSGTATNPPKARPRTKAASAASTAQVKLIEAGAEPRKALRLHPSPGDEQKVELTVKLSMATKAGDQASPAMNLPAIKMTLEAKVKSIADNGDIACEMGMGDIGVSDAAGAAPEVVEAIKGVFSGIKGLSGSGTVTSRGINQGIEFKAPPGNDPQVSQMMEQMKDFYTQIAIQLPEEAVGVGAKWQVSMPITTQGMTIEQKAVYEIVAIEGERVTTRSTVTQHAANQRIQNPALGGMKMDLTQMSGQGTGERTTDLTKLLPVSAAGEMHSETSTAMSMGGQKQVMTMKMDVNLRVQSK